MRARVNHVVGLGSEDRWCNGGQSRVVQRLSGHAQDHGGRLLCRLRRQLEVSGHERVLREHRRLDGCGYSYDRWLRGHTVVEGRWLREGVGVGQEAGLAHHCYRCSPGPGTWWSNRQRIENNQYYTQLLHQEFSAHSKCLFQRSVDEQQSWNGLFSFFHY